MSNFDMAVEWGINMTKMVKNGGTVYLGLVGSGLNRKQIDLVFKKINAVIQVKFIKAEVGLVLVMERI